MNKLLLHTLMAAGVLLCGSSSSACDPVLLARHAQNLACLASEMDASFREDLCAMHRYCPPSHAELRFQQALCQLSGIASQFRCAVDQGSTACELKRYFEAVQEAYGCVEGCAGCVKVCASICGMMQRFELSMGCLQDMGFEVTTAPNPLYGHHHHGHGEFEGATPSNGWFRVPMSQSPSFIFRQPLR